jgi:Na+-driven multidrug efflux pump
MINAIGISNLYLNCTLMSIYMGLVSGIETLCANAYATKQYKLMGYYYQRARIVGYFVTIVIVIFHLCTIQYILGLFSLNDQVITYSSHYVYSILIYVFFDV